MKDPDAGLRGLGHYERRLPAWRFVLRTRLIPIVRAETPYLAYLQRVCRSPYLDSFFAISANLGTHTFFMTALPVCFWCGYPELGLALVQMLALGVYLSGYVKDMVCLPRPLSPPLQRITMSGSAALEYGFPSTHSTNAMSVVVYGLYQLYASRETLSDFTYGTLSLLCYCYALSICLGRMYCGMHGFSDVIFGGVVGSLIAWLRIVYGSSFDQWILQGGWTSIGITVIIAALAVRVHPEPADNCPCFDDSVAFSGVVMGIEFGSWHYAASALSRESTAQPYVFENHNLIYPIARVVLGIVVIFLWRAVMKSLLLRTLPSIFRFVDHWGFRIPRRYFLQSRDYKQVPPLRKDDNVIPHASAISSMVSNLRNRRPRAVSIGPQSEADAREFIANREQRRRNSRATDKSPRSRSSTITAPGISLSAAGIEEDVLAPPISESEDHNQTSFVDAGKPRSLPSKAGAALLQPSRSEANFLTPPLSDNGAASDAGSGKEDEKNDREMFSGLEKPRIRYDVEVITKLVVYAGIGWLASEGDPRLFEMVGLT